MSYLLDANVFIQAKNLHYGLDFCPAFWDWLAAENANGNVFSIEKVGDELAAGGDELSDWADDRGADFFLKPDTALLPALGTVSAWAAGQSYEPAAVNTFLLVADYYLVAHALAHGHTVVTHEKASTSTKKIKILSRALASASNASLLTRCCGVNGRVLYLEVTHHRSVINHASKETKHSVKANLHVLELTDRGRRWIWLSMRIRKRLGR